MHVLFKVLSFLFPPRSSELRVHEASLEEVHSLLDPSLIATDITALLPYRHPLVSSLVIEAKYHENQKAFKLLGAVLAEYLQEFVADQDAFETHAFVLVPMPLSAKRQRERGYNQARKVVEEAQLCLGLSPHTSSVLEKVKDTPSQTTLDRTARLCNLVGAFRAQQVNPAHTYILVDDVVTTGATLHAARDALVAAGGTHVIAIALAH